MLLGMNAPKKPETVSLYLLRQIQESVYFSSPAVVAQESADRVRESGGKPSNRLPLPKELIVAHVRYLRDLGASEEAVDRDLNYLLDVFEAAVFARSHSLQPFSGKEPSLASSC